MLMRAVDFYLAVRRAAGYELTVTEYLLRDFVRFAADRGEAHVRSTTAIAWAAGAPSLSQRDRRLRILIGFARHVSAEDSGHEVPPPRVFGVSPQRRRPYIFTPARSAGSWRGPQRSARQARCGHTPIARCLGSS